MTEPNTTELAGHTWRFERIDDRKAFEAECLLAHLAGPSAATAVGGLIEGLAVELLGLARDVCRTPTAEEEEDLERETPPPRFDLARLLALRDADTTDPRIEAAWDSFVDGMPAVLGQVLADSAPQLAERLGDHSKVLRLFELHVLGSTFVHAPAGWRKLAKLEALGEFSKRAPGVKWALLLAAMRLHYLGAVS